MTWSEWKYGNAGVKACRKRNPPARLIKAQDSTKAQIDERPCPECSGNRDYVCTCGDSSCKAGCDRCDGAGVE